MDSVAFWDRVADKYAARPIEDMDAYERMIARVRDRLSPDDNVLEVGCGTGMTAVKLAPSVLQVTATDPSRNFLAIARDRALQSEVDNIRFARRAVEDLAPGQFDVVLAFNVLHLLPSAKDGARALAGQLRPGGYLISKTPCLAGGLKGVGLRVAIEAMRAVGRAPKVRFLNAHRIEQAIAAAGLDIVEADWFTQGVPGRFVIARKP